MMSPAMVLNYVAVNTPLDTLAITDHDTMDGWEQALEFKNRPENDHLAHFDLIPGAEISSRDGHIIGLWLQKLVPKGLDTLETIAAIHEQGGVAMAAHPFAWLPGLQQFAGVGLKFMTAPFDAVEVRNSTPTEFFNNMRCQRMNKNRPQPAAEVGSSDSHFLWAIARTWTEFPGKGAAGLRQAIQERTTRAGGLTWGPISLLNYYRDRRRWKNFCTEHRVELRYV